MTSKLPERGSAEQIPVTPVGAGREDRAYQAFLVASLLLAVLLGFALGIHVPVARLTGGGSPERALDLTQAHGQVQLLGFAGLFVMGVSLRLMPRFAGASLAYAGLAPVTLASFVASLAMRALLLPWLEGTLHGGVLVATGLGLAAGSACFLFLTVATLTLEARRFDASSLAFVIGATLLFLGTTTSAVVALHAALQGERAPPYLADAAVIQIVLTGFVFSFIVGVASRAIPVMVGVERPGRSAGVLAVLLAATVLLIAAMLLLLQYVAYEHVFVLLADAGFAALGAVLLALVWQAGVFRQVANRLRPASQPALWLLRSAFAWLAVAAIVSLYAGTSSLVDGEFLGQHHLDALRHALGLGVITNLIAGMAMMILPEFAVARQRANRQRALALLLALLLNIASVLRVGAALGAVSWPAEDRNIVIATAGVLAEAALIIFAVYLLRLMRRL